MGDVRHVPRSRTTTTTTNSYAFWDGAVQSQVRYDPGSGAAFTSNYKYDAFGRLTSATINDGRPRTVTWTNGIDGQAIRRDEADNNYSNGDPHEVFYRLGGKQLGMVGNNGTDNVDYASSTGQRTATQGTGAFRGGASYGAFHADFGLDYDATNSFNQGSAGGIYTVRSGDTLQGVAMQLWGDAGLWYKLADANGLSAASALSEGRTLTIPTGIQRNHHSAATIKPYDPAEALGDTSPTTPQPAQPKKSKKCGFVGAILLAVVAVAVAAWLGPQTIAFFQGAFAGAGTAVAAGSAAAIGGGIVGGAVAGAAASIASQAVGLATGIQDKFSFKGVALSALGGGIGGGLTGIAQGIGAAGNVVEATSGFGKFLANGGIGAGIVRGAITSAATQGIAVATGLQSKFSWAGVAAASLAAGSGDWAAGKLGLAQGSFGFSAASAAVGGIAGAATRSAIEGTSFGKNLVAAIPDIVGQAIGGAIAKAVSKTPAAAPADPALSGPINNISSALAASPTASILQTPALQVTTSPAANNAATAGEEVEIVVTARRTGSGSNPAANWPSSAASQASGLALRNLSEAPPELELATGATQTIVKSFSKELVDAYERKLWPSLRGKSWAEAKAAIAAHFQAESSALNRSLLFADEHRVYFESGGRAPLPIASWTVEVPLSLPSQMLNSFASSGAGAALYGYMGIDVPQVSALNPGAFKAGKVVGYAAMLAGIVGGGRAIGRAASVETERVFVPTAAESAGVRGLGASPYATNGDLVQSIAIRANDWGVRNGLGNGPVAGTLKHGYAEEVLTRYQRMFGDRGLTAEARYAGGAPWQPGMTTTGSIRLDVVEGPLTNPTRVWDYKFGQATLSSSRITQIQNGIPNGANVPILMVKP